MSKLPGKLRIGEPIFKCLKEHVHDRRTCSFGFGGWNIPTNSSISEEDPPSIVIEGRQYEDGTETMTPEVAARVVACWNACLEMPDPESGVKALIAACKVGLGYVAATEHSLRHIQPNVVTKDADQIRAALLSAGIKP